MAHHLSRSHQQARGFTVKSRKNEGRLPTSSPQLLAATIRERSGGPPPSGSEIRQRLIDSGAIRPSTPRPTLHTPLLGHLTPLTPVKDRHVVKLDVRPVDPRSES